MCSAGTISKSQNPGNISLDNLANDSSASLLNSYSAPVFSTFSLLLADAEDIECYEVVRVVTGRRLVCRGIWCGKQVFAKIFFGTQAAKYYQRELDGLNRLQAANVLTPALLFTGRSKDDTAYVIISEAINGARNADECLKQADETERLVLAKRLIQAVAEHHRAGLIQTDLYPKNFLIQGDHVYTIDGDAIRHLPTFFRSWFELNNLSILLSKFDILDLKKHQSELLEAYKSVRQNLAGSPCMITWLAMWHRHKTMRTYADKKVFRQCSDVAVTQTQDSYLAINRTCDEQAIASQMQNPDVLLNAASSTMLKLGNTCTIGMVTLGGMRAVVKRYNIKNFWHGLGRAFRPSRAARSWANAFRLILCGISTPKPIALLEKRFFGLRREAYFVSEFVDALDVAQFFEVENDANHRQEVAEELANLFYKLYLLRISHGDFKATNIKILAGSPVLLDLDSMVQHRCSWWSTLRHARDLKRFMRNWQHQPQLQEIFKSACKARYKEHKPLKLAGII